MIALKKIIKPELWKNQAYEVPDRTNLIKLDAMEMPFEWPKTLKTNILDFQSLSLNRYPGHHKTLIEKIKDHFKFPKNTSILLGNGSDEIIQTLMLAIQVKEKILTLTPSFSMYQIIAQHIGLSVIQVDLKPNFEINTDQVIEKIKQHQPAIFFIATPNNPTGNAFKKHDLQKIIETSKNTLIILDEAYQPFCNHINHQAWLEKYPNVAMMRTFSKIGFAGLRFGFITAQPWLIEQLEKIRLPYNLNICTQHAIKKLLEQPDVIDNAIKKLNHAKTKLLESLQNIEPLQTHPSNANFFLVQIQHPFCAVKLYKFLKTKGILIKCLSDTHPLLQNTIRITVGTPAENAMLTKHMQAFFSCKPKH